ncbi:MAG: prepilin peptidase [Oscillospiraceae bacterium]
MIYFIYFILFLFVFFYGACFASFIAAFAYRYSKGLKISKGRSFCEGCGSTLKAIDLIPVFSYIFLNGRCRVCKQKIPVGYFLTEIVGGCICLLCFFRFDFSYSTLLASGVGLTLLCVALVDEKIMTIPDRCQVLLLGLGIISLWVLDTPIKCRIIGIFSVSVALVIVNILCQKLLGQAAFGGGDIKLTAVCGFLLGWQNMLLAMFIALVFGGGYAIYLLVKKRQRGDTQIPFGPYLAVGIFTAMLYGDTIIQGYLRLTGLS